MSAAEHSHEGERQSAAVSVRHRLPAETSVKPQAFLRKVSIERCGWIRDRSLDGLGPGFNVVFGPNEAGKSTIAQFIAGVLFGFDETSRGGLTGQNETRQCTGSLVFRTVGEGDSPRDYEVRRESAHEQAPLETPLLDDIDEATFRTLFLLTGDELRGLRSSTELLGRLLNMQVGTKLSPTKALAQLRAAIEQICDEEDPASLPSLVRERIRLREALQEAGTARRELIATWEERRALERDQADLTVQADAAMKAIEALERGQDSLQAMERDEAKLAETLATLQSAQADARQTIAALTDEVPPELLSLRERDERTLRQRLAELEEETLRLEASEAMAARQLSQSQAALSLAAKGPDEESGSTPVAPAAMASAAQRQPVSRSVSVGVCAGICALLTIIGVPLFLYGRGLGSLSIAVLGVGLVIFAVLMAATTLVLAFRPGRESMMSGDEERTARLRDAQWIVRQDEERLESIRLQRKTLETRTADELAKRGFGSDALTLREARQQLDDARTVRGELIQENQREQAAVARIAETERELAAISERRRTLLASLQLPDEAHLATLTEELERRRQQYRALQTAVDHLASRKASLDEPLAQAEADRSFDELKLTHQMVRTRIADKSETLSRLLLAKRQLEAALSTWGSRNQPGVYAQASRYLAAITDGRWVSVTMQADGRLTVGDGAGGFCDPAELSLGTVQQLYLAMRLALLHEATAVGRAVPMVADDILVNFDTARQERTLRILGDLATSRQIIFLTCHDETRDLIKRVLADKNCDLRILTL